jgi:hypothetical protein
MERSDPNTIPVSLGFVPWSFDISLLKKIELSLDPNQKNFLQVGAFKSIQQIDSPGDLLPQWITVAQNFKDGELQTVPGCDPPP